MSKPTKKATRGCGPRMAFMMAGFTGGDQAANVTQDFNAL
jgi:hypothetical protein